MPPDNDTLVTKLKNKLDTSLKKLTDLENNTKKQIQAQKDALKTKLTKWADPEFKYIVSLSEYFNSRAQDSFLDSKNVKDIGYPALSKTMDKIVTELRPLLNISTGDMLLTWTNDNTLGINHFLNAQGYEQNKKNVLDYIDNELIPEIVGTGNIDFAKIRAIVNNVITEVKICVASQKLGKKVDANAPEVQNFANLDKFIEDEKKKAQQEYGPLLSKVGAEVKFEDGMTITEYETAARKAIDDGYNQMKQSLEADSEVKNILSDLGMNLSGAGYSFPDSIAAIPGKTKDECLKYLKNKCLDFLKPKVIGKLNESKNKCYNECYSAIDTSLNGIDWVKEISLDYGRHINNILELYTKKIGKSPVIAEFNSEADKSVAQLTRDAQGLNKSISDIDKKIEEIKSIDPSLSETISNAWTKCKSESKNPISACDQFIKTCQKCMVNTEDSSKSKGKKSSAKGSSKTKSKESPANNLVDDYSQHPVDMKSQTSDENSLFEGASDAELEIQGYDPLNPQNDSE